MSRSAALCGEQHSDVAKGLLGEAPELRQAVLNGLAKHEEGDVEAGALLPHHPVRFDHYQGFLIATSQEVETPLKFRACPVHRAMTVISLKADREFPVSILGNYVVKYLL
jgi:hypothetical protein